MIKLILRMFIMEKIHTLLMVGEVLIEVIGEVAHIGLRYGMKILV